MCLSIVLVYRYISMSDYIISTKRLGLRHWLDSDLIPFALMNQDKEVMKYFPHTLTREESAGMLQRIQTQFDKHGVGLYAVECKATHEFIGFTGFSIPNFESHFTPCIEIGWRFKKEVWGNGYATEAANACLQYGFQTLNFEKIVSFTAAINQSSEKVMKRIGMQYLGRFEHPKIEKDHILCEHVVYQLTKSEFEKNQ
jgi:[ribosomal protein S5]-alanine N-acetyltransferase